MLLKYFGLHGRFPKSPHEVSRAAIQELASQLHVEESTWLDYNWFGRTIKLHRAEIRKSYGYRTATVEDGENLVEWLCSECLGQTRRYEHIEFMALDRLSSLKIESPASYTFCISSIRPTILSAHI